MTAGWISIIFFQALIFFARDFSHFFAAARRPAKVSKSNHENTFCPTKVFFREKTGSRELVYPHGVGSSSF